MKLNVSKTIEYMKNSKNVNISKKVVNQVFNEIRNILHKYYIIQYQTEPLGEKDAS